MPRKVDDYLTKEAEHGKRDNQKLKPYVVLQYLMRNTDEDNVASAADIIGFLEGCGIGAERRGIYRDIAAINEVNYMLENDVDIEEAKDAIAEDEFDDDKLIAYDSKKKGFYVKNRSMDLNDVRLLAECVYSARFITENQAKRLLDAVCELCSEHQEDIIRHSALLTDRIRTDNRATLNNIAAVNAAMKKTAEHLPHKITFEYLYHTVSALDKPQPRKNKYVVSPFHVLITDGNYYLLAFEDKSQKIKTYRIDRMRSVEETSEPRDGEAEFVKINLQSYTQRLFGMFGGKEEAVQIRFTNDLLDTVLDRLGTKNAAYQQADDRHFIVKAAIEISDQFYGWLLGFGNKVKIIGPPSVVDKFKEYLDKVYQMYE